MAQTTRHAQVPSRQKFYPAPARRADCLLAVWLLWRRGRGIEELLALPGVGADRRLAGLRHQPVAQLARRVLPGFGVLPGIEQDYVVAVQQPGIAFDQHLELGLVGEGEPGTAVAQRIG